MPICPGGHRCPHELPRYDAMPIIRRFESPSTAAAILEVAVRSVHRWIATGLTPIQADRLAIRVGLHPCDVWSSWFDDAETWFAEHDDGRERRGAKAA
jgi:hypothetical protein